MQALGDTVTLLCRQAESLKELKESADENDKIVLLPFCQGVCLSNARPKPNAYPLQ